jgi:hypothetical protein
VVRYVNELMRDAFCSGMADIHPEATRHDSQRYR